MLGWFSSDRNNPMNRKKLSTIILLILIIAVSVLAVMPEKMVDHDSGDIASELEISESVDGNVTSTSYVNTEGKVTDAIDMGYATVQRTRNADGRITEEFYLDAEGNPVKRYDDYCGIAYEYADDTVKITYLDDDGLPMMRSAGYATIVRTVDDNGRAIDDYYYDLDMQPVSCNGYYGQHREYGSNGQNNSVAYLDRDGQPVCSTSGYACKRYDRDDLGTLTAEHYFDVQGNPAKAPLGQYGERYQRDENSQIIQITYLDADGSPAPTSVGYTILKRTYHRDGTAATDMYFDEDGNPIALSKGQYGIKHSGKVSLLLTKSGNIMLCVDNILNGFPAMVVVSGVIICILMLLLPEKVSVALTIAYVVFILYETLMFRETGDARTNFVLFSYADRFFAEQSVRVGVINNIWLFIPLGTGLYRNIRKKWVLLIPLLFSIAIETTQYITGLGIAEFDDVFGNTLGGWIGIVVAWTAANVRKTSMESIKKILQDRAIPFFKNKIRYVWYFILVVASTVYLFCNYFAIDKINDASLISTVFIIWVILLVLPLFTELEFFGVKVKKEVKEAVEKSNKEVKDSINNLQQLVMQIQVSNNATNQLTINGNPLPSETKIEELTNEIRALVKQNKGTEKENTKENVSIPEQNVTLFKIRYGIEVELRECLELLKFESKIHITIIQMANILNGEGLLDPTITDMLIQTIRVSNRAIHGEMVNQKYVDFATQAYPQIMDALQECKNRIKTMI